ncbi:hypothetical protein CC78DRAFT_578804 [Lojkania enalia]|uniref:Uncharacterized protein n=1 Tax=Lojkania enalia TaxID=147567 RepID=A0A9P4KCA9_9PLEO|nr:hypothetical protein CC78DRAFT_578804 [Didymosphaeria enalia]
MGTSMKGIPAARTWRRPAPGSQSCARQPRFKVQRLGKRAGQWRNHVPVGPYESLKSTRAKKANAGGIFSVLLSSVAFALGGALLVNEQSEPYRQPLKLPRGEGGTYGMCLGTIVNHSHLSIHRMRRTGNRHCNGGMYGGVVPRCLCLKTPRYAGPREIEQLSLVSSRKNQKSRRIASSDFQ